MSIDSNFLRFLQSNMTLPQPAWDPRADALQMLIAQMARQNRQPGPLDYMDVPDPRGMAQARGQRQYFSASPVEGTRRGIQSPSPWRGSGPTHRDPGPHLEPGESRRFAGAPAQPKATHPARASQQPPTPTGRTGRWTPEDLAKLDQWIKEHYDRSDAGRRKALGMKPPTVPSGNLGWKQALLAGGLAMGLNMLDSRRQAGAGFGQGFLDAHGRKVNADYENASQQAQWQRDKALGEADIDSDIARRFEGRRDEMRREMEEDRLENERRLPPEVLRSIAALEDPDLKLTEDEARAHFSVVDEYSNRKGQQSMLSGEHKKQILEAIRAKNAPPELDADLKDQTATAIGSLNTSIKKIGDHFRGGKGIAYNEGNLKLLTETNEAVKADMRKLRQIILALRNRVNVLDASAMTAQTERERSQIIRERDAYAELLRKAEGARYNSAHQIAAMGDQLGLWGMSAANDGFGVLLPPHMEWALASVGYKKPKRVKEKKR